jgi:hypothetical protein
VFEVWVKVVVDFSIVSEHLVDVLFANTVSFKIEVEIEIIIHLEWLEFWNIFSLFVHPELVWVHDKVDGCSVLFLLSHGTIEKETIEQSTWTKDLFVQWLCSK